MINRIKPVVPVNKLPKSKHSTEDPNERQRRQLLLTHGYTTDSAEIEENFSEALNDTVEHSKEERKD